MRRIYGLGLACLVAALLSSCESSGGAGGRSVYASPQSGTRASAENAGLRAPRHMRGLRGLRQPEVTRASRAGSSIGASVTGASAATPGSPSIGALDPATGSGTLNVAGFHATFSRPERTLYFAPGTASGPTLPHAQAPSGVTPAPTHGGVFYDPVTGTWSFR